MRIVPIVSAAVLLGGCAFPGAVQRVGVEYNTAVAGMANELTLLNILRAKEDLPLHYTAVSRLSGSVTVKSGGNINVGIRGDGTTGTSQAVDTLTTAAAPTGTTTTSSNAITGITQVVEGVEVTTPTISGEITTGPTFDVAVLDTQKFYNGILAAIPFSTVENYISQGIDEQLLMRLLIERIEFRSTDGANPGELLGSWRNEPGTPDGVVFAGRMGCYRLSGHNLARKAVDLVPVSRIRSNDSASLIGLTLQEVALLDGKTLDLSAPIQPDKKLDDQIMVRRPGVEKRIAQLIPLPSILESIPDRLPAEDRVLWNQCGAVRNARSGQMPELPPEDPVYLGNSQALVLGLDGRSSRVAAVEQMIVFRSTESVIRYLGRYLESGNQAEKLNGTPVFSVKSGRSADALVTAEVLRKHYSIVNDANRRRNMLVIAVIQQLVNLHKESADRPLTVPVQVVGG